jgi:hypothetical protein
MIRRVLTAVTFLAVALVLVAPPAGGAGKELYPPTPIVVKVPVTPVVERDVVVVVRRVPVARPRPLAVTGSSALVPMTVLAAGAVLFGAAIVILTRVRRPNFSRYRNRPG